MAAPAAANRSSSSSSARSPPHKRHGHLAAPMDDEGDGAAAAGGAQPLLPGLPDHLAQLCLSPLPPRLLHATCHPWRRLLYSPSVPPFSSLYALLDDADGVVSFAAYDPMAERWDALPAPEMPSPPPMLWHPSFLSRRLPLQSVAAAGRLVLVAGSTRSLQPALSHPMVFDPAAAKPRWLLGPRIPLSPRRWCAAGAARGRVFIAGGVGACYDPAVARSGALWDPAAPSSPWEPLPPLRDGRFSRDAAEAVCSGGKVCMVNVRSRSAKEGAVFDLDAGRWEDMPLGMLVGWKGPAAAASSPDGAGGDTIFAVDEERGSLNAYHWGTDRWRTVVAAERLKGAAELAVGGGRACVVADGGAKVVVVDITRDPSRESKAPPRPRMWEVAAPAGKRVVALHVLPRMTRPD